jgi:hypothetical protein
LELQEAAQATNTAYLMTSQRGASAPMERALFVLGELRAKDLRERSAQHLAGLPPGENKRALELRNRLAALLYDRMNQVRSVARFVFRRHPDLGAESDQRLSAAPPHCRQPRSPRIRNDRPSGHEPSIFGA